jgi:hypothetical protein
VQEECSKWGKVERLVIYNERQSEDDEPTNANVKIFVQFADPDGECVHHHLPVVKFPIPRYLVYKTHAARILFAIHTPGTLRTAKATCGCPEITFVSVPSVHVVF